MTELSVTRPKGHYPMRSSSELLFKKNPKDQSQMLFNKTHVHMCGPSYLDVELEVEKLEQSCVCERLTDSST